ATLTSLSRGSAIFPSRTVTTAESCFSFQTVMDNRSCLPITYSSAIGCSRFIILPTDVGISGAATIGNFTGKAAIAVLGGDCTVGLGSALSPALLGSEVADGTSIA